MFDVDNKDSSVGMSCPPAAFVETAVLQKVFNLLTPRGKQGFNFTTYIFLGEKKLRIICNSLEIKVEVHI